MDSSASSILDVIEGAANGKQSTRQFRHHRVGTLLFESSFDAADVSRWRSLDQPAELHVRQPGAGSVAGSRVWRRRCRANSPSRPHHHPQVRRNHCSGEPFPGRQRRLGRARHDPDLRRRADHAARRLGRATLRHLALGTRSPWRRRAGNVHGRHPDGTHR